MTDRRREAVEQRLRHARRDLEELTTQLDDGEIDEATASRLRARYESDVAEAEAQLASMPTPKASKTPEATSPQAASPGEKSAASPAGTRRALWIMGGVVVALTVVIVFLARSGGEEEPTAEGASPPPTGAPGSAGGFTEMEAAVAADPTNMPLRLALGGMYFELGEYIPAMQHYLVVIEGEATEPERSVALGRVGFLAYVTEQYDAAVTYIQQGIDADPDNGENYLFMGVVQLYGLGDAEAAVPSFESVLALPDCTAQDTGPCIPSELRIDVERMLSEAQDAGGEG
jgi:tetratricopeptide (TPR) repeat protein